MFGKKVINYNLEKINDVKKKTKNFKIVNKINVICRKNFKI